MSLTVRAKVNNGESPPFELFSEALTLTSPPLSQDSRAAIDQIREERLGSLEGADRFEAVKIFDELDRLPPIEGPRAARLLTLVADSDFSESDLKSAFSQMEPKDPENSITSTDEWGYFSSPAVARDLQSDQEESGEVLIDMQRSERTGLQSTVQIYVSLSRIEDPDTRKALVADCAAIVDLRLSFDFTTEER